MQNLGQTRSSRQPDHFLLTPDTFVRAPLPGMWNATAVVHAAPAHGAGFAQYTVELGKSGSMQTGAHQTFVFVLRGDVQAGTQTLKPNGYAYIPTNSHMEITAASEAVIEVIEKPYIKQDHPEPSFFTGDESSIAPVAFMGDERLHVRTLIPPGPQFDFAVNTMTFAPGTSLPLVEIHVMEHGLLMLEGGGIYRLNDHWYPVTAGDFIYMAPYCPQWFAAIGKTPARYLIYKDWNRHPLCK